MDSQRCDKTARARQRPKAPGQRGYALAIVLIFTACLFTVWASLFSYAQAARKWAGTSEAKRQAIWAARAGLVHRAAQIQIGRRGGVAKPALCGLGYKVEEKVDGRDIVLTSTVKTGKKEQTVVEWQLTDVL